MFALLDETKARVRMLVAPAGYGKTTLAEQWVARDGRRAAWFTARSSATDVAALALGIAKSATSIVEGCDVRLRAHMRALPAPAENVQTLAEILGEDLGAWPSDAWLVIDDYHEIADEPRAEDFVQALVAASSAHILIASRVRPAWIATKDLLYGEAFEVNQTALAMDNAEAADILVGRSARAASGLVLLANGWPAVIGLAGVSSAEIEENLDQVPESLYRFFADEVFTSLGGDVQQGITTLSVAPALTSELAGALLGAHSSAVVTSALDVGILVERDTRLDLHPLARAFLKERVGRLGLVPAQGAVDTCITHYRLRGEWDAAFETAAGNAAVDDLEALMHEALAELIDTGRLQTVETWNNVASDRGLTAAIFLLSRGVVALRLGRPIEAMSNAQAAAERDPALAYRAMSIAGTAAHLASREEDALAFFGRAEAAAATESERRDASWGELTCLIDLEDPGAHAALARLSEGISLGQPREFVRAAAHLLYLQVRQGSLDLEHADVAYDVLPGVDDPLVESSFLSCYATALGLSARYENGLQASADLLLIVETYRLDFAIPYALCASALARSGLRQWRQAEEMLNRALELSRSTRDAHAELLAASLLIRLQLHKGRPTDALRVPAPGGHPAPASSVAEYMCSRALALACIGRADDALSEVDASPQSSAVEPLVLAAIVRAVCAIRSGHTDAVDAVSKLEAIAFGAGAVDLLIIGYRACPEILTILLRTGSDQLRSLVARVGDADLATAVGMPLPADEKRTSLLSPREREVHDLMVQGLKNREIGKLLFIEESTVKAHTHHIYDKLGTHSRRALIVQAMLERSDQATSATESSTPESGS